MLQHITKLKYNTGVHLVASFDVGHLEPFTFRITGHADLTGAVFMLILSEIPYHLSQSAYISTLMSGYLPRNTSLRDRKYSRRVGETEKSWEK
jgi:hypothetical protein